MGKKDFAYSKISSSFLPGGFLLQKRSCIRFKVPGATLCYRKKPGLLRKNAYSEDRFPVLNLSRGGAKFLSDERPRVGMEIDVRIHIPEIDQTLELSGVIRWAGRNHEASYQFQAGISFAPYGNSKNENPPEALDAIKRLESAYSVEAEIA